MELLVISHLDDIKIEGSHTALICLHPSQDVRALTTAFCIDRGIDDTSDYVIKNGEGDVLHASRQIATCGLEDGDKVFITMAGTEVVLSSFGCNSWWFLAFPALFLGTCALVGLCVAKNALDGNPVYRSALVAEVGHRSLRVTLYRWNATKYRGTGLVKIKKDCSVPGGITYYVDRPELAGIHLLHCLNKPDMLEALSGTELATTHLYYGFSSCMNQLRSVNGTLASDIEREVKMAVNRTVYKLRHTLFTVNSVDEAAYIWISANYLLKTFIQPHHTSIHTDQTTSVVAMGPETLILVYSSFPGKNIPQDSRKVVTIFNKKYYLNVVASSCLGWEEGIKEKTHRLSQGSSSSETILDTCLPSGVATDIGSSEIHSAFCSRNSASAQNFQTLKINGSFDVRNCLAIVNDILRGLPCLSSYNNSCEIPPKLNDELLLLPVFSDVVNVLRAKQSHQKSGFTLNDLSAAVSSECSTNNSGLTFDTSGILRYNTCFLGLYVEQLLLEKYHITEEIWDKAVVKEKIQGEPVTWCLGFIVSKTTSMPSEFPVVHIPLILFMPISFLCIIVLVIAIGLACKAWLTETEARSRGYKNLRSGR